jgi:hypothetical protein
MKMYQKKYYEENREKRLEYYYKYYEENRESILAKRTTGRPRGRPRKYVNQDIEAKK